MREAVCGGARTQDPRRKTQDCRQRLRSGIMAWSNGPCHAPYIRKAKAWQHRLASYVLYPDAPSTAKRFRAKGEGNAPYMRGAGAWRNGARTQDARPKTQDWRQRCEAGVWRDGAGFYRAVEPESRPYHRHKPRSVGMAVPQTLRATVLPRAPCKPAGGPATGLGGPRPSPRHTVRSGSVAKPQTLRASACSV